MATPMRRPDPSLIEALYAEPFRFSFLQAVRLLERLRPGRTPVGHDGPPRSEAVRFGGLLSMTFPPNEVSDLTPGDPGPEGGPARMVTTFLGLIGVSGALPLVYTEALMAMRGRRNAAALDFLDLFHHRIASLHYRSWEKYNVPALWERARSGGAGVAGEDAFTRHLFDFLGLGARPLRDRQSVRDESLLYYAGFFAQQHRSAVVLELLLRDYFGRPATVVTFQGRWLRLEPDQRSRLGRAGGYNRLGTDTVIGGKVWDDQGKFRVRLGPLGYDEFLDFLPGGRLTADLADLVRFYARGELDFDVQLVLKAAEVPGCLSTRDPRSAARLGRTSWLKCREFDRDAGDAVFRPGARAPAAAAAGAGARARAGEAS